MPEDGAGDLSSRRGIEPVPHSDVPAIDPSATLALAQGGYYLVSGVWPLLSLDTFQAVTGRKREPWLVRTVGVLVAIIGGVLLRGGLRRQLPSDLALLGAGSALGLAGVDVVYVARGRISPVYLFDAVIEMLLAAGWAWARGNLPAREHPR